MKNICPNTAKQFLPLAILLLLLFQTTQSFAQLTGIKTIPGDYATISLAVLDLNLQGVGAGGVIFNVAAGHTETLSGKIIQTATGTAANPIAFQKSGLGANPILTAYVGTVATPSVLADGFWVLAGSDYVTINGIDLQESAANTTTTTVMEFGYGLFKTSNINGCQHNLIQNCTITLNKLQNAAWTAPGHNGSVGIAVLNGLYTATGTVTVSNATGSNSFNQFYSNTIQNCNAGIVFVGYVAPSPFTLGDTNNDIGGNAVATGNTILNFGGGGAANPATGILASAQWGLNVSYNTLNNNNGAGANHATTMRGIFLNGSSTSASANCNFNNLTLNGGATTSDLTFIENAFGTTPASNTININNNTLTGSYLTATTGTFRGIYNNAATPATLNIQNNTISNLSYSDAANVGTGALYTINTSGSNAAMTINVSGNTISNISRTGTTGGTTIGIFIAAGVNNMLVFVNNNTIQNMSIGGTGTTSSMYGIETNTGTIVNNNNLVDGLRCTKTTGTGVIYGIYNTASPVNENYSNNTIRNLIHSGTGIVYGLFFDATTSTRTLSNNLIHTLSSNGSNIAGINTTSSSPTLFQNKIYNIETTAIGAVTVSGILQGTLGTAGISNIYNNLIGDLRALNASSTATTPSIRAICITTTTVNSSINISFNTVLLNASSTAANFGSAGLYITGSATATTANLTLKNNVIVNLSTQNGTSNTVAYQRSSTSLANYDLSSNNNLFYAGTPGLRHLIFYDGTNSDQTLANFKTRVSTRETLSVTENPPFLSIIGSNPSFLHINTTIATQIESGGVNIAGITNDYDTDIRQGNVGYLGTGTAPDLGADEGDFMPSDISAPIINYTLIPNSICFSNTTLSATITDPSGVNTTVGTKPRLWFKKSTENNVLPATNTAADNGWKWVEASNAASPFSFTIDYNLLNTPATYGDVIQYFVVAQDEAGAPNVGKNIAIFNAGNIASSVLLAANIFPVTNTNSFTIPALPPSITSLASPNELCFSGDVNLSLNSANLGAEYQWESSPMGANTWTAIPSATSVSYLATGVSSSMDYRCIISCASVPVAGISPSLVGSVTVTAPQVLTTVSGSACSSNPISVSLSGTTNIGSVLNWYNNPTGGSPVATGNTFNTPLISSTTSYYVAASEGNSISSVGPLNPTIGTTSASTNVIGTQRTFFNVLADATILSVDIFPTATIGANGTIVVRNNTQTVIATIPYTTTVTGGAKQTVPLNLFLPAGTGYEIGQGTGIGLNRNTTGAVYPYTSPSINITGNSINANYFCFFYNWQISTDCESPRLPVVATVSNSSASGTDTRTACSSYTWINGNTYTTSNSTATFTIAGGAAGGCDSIVTLNLTINNPTAGTDTQTACGSYMWIDGNIYFSNNNIATHTLVGGAANGCDSVVTLNLTINNNAAGTDTQTACDSYIWIDGNTYTNNNNTATHTLVGGAANGCDSVVTLNLTINTVDTVVMLAGTTLTANATGATYQWVDCNNGNAPIVGETNQNYTPTVTGDYAVEISQNGCTSTSSCYNVLIVGVKNIANNIAFNLYPNPATTLITIEMSELGTIELYNATGQLIWSQMTQTKLLTKDIGDLPSGVYTVRFVYEGGAAVKVFVVR